MSGWRRAAAVLLALAACACGGSSAREYTLEGQVLRIDRNRREITIKHGDIAGFMPGMTMPFKVSEGSLLSRATEGDIVRATLVVRDTDAHLRTIERIGHAPLPPGSRLPIARSPMRTGSRGVSKTGVVRRLPSRSHTLAVRCPTSAL